MVRVVLVLAGPMGEPAILEVSGQPFWATLEAEPHESRLGALGALEDQVHWAHEEFEGLSHSCVLGNIVGRNHYISYEIIVVLEDFALCGRLQEGDLLGLD